MKKNQLLKLIVMVGVAAIVIYNIATLMWPEKGPDPDKLLTTPIPVIVEEVKYEPEPEPKVIVIEPKAPEAKEVNINVTVQDPIPVEVTPAPPQEPAPTPPPQVVYVPQPAPAPTPQPQPESQPEPAQAEVIEEQNMTTLEIISPIARKGLGRDPYTAQPEVVDESNYVELGVVVRDGNGNVLKDVEVVIEGTDSQFNKTLNGTGNITKIYDENGTAKSVHYYPFHYEFKTVGDHTITFTSDGQSESVTINVVEPEPA